MLQSVLFHLDGVLVKPEKCDQLLSVNEEIFQFIPSLFQDFENYQLQIYVITNQSKEYIASIFPIHAIENYITAIGFIDHNNPSDQIKDLLQDWNIQSNQTIGLIASNHLLGLMNDYHIPSVGYQNLYYPDDNLSNCKFLVEGFDSLDYTYIEYVYHYVHELPQIIVRTNRLIIRELTIDDIPALHSIANQIQIKDKINDMRGSIEEEQDKMSAYMKYIYGFYGIGLWGVYLNHNHQLIGRAGVEYKQAEDQNNYYELGFYIDYEFQGKGYGEEAVLAIIDYCFEAIMLPTIVAFVDMNNDRSKKLLQRVGMRFDSITTRNNQNVHRYILHNPNQ